MGDFNNNAGNFTNAIVLEARNAACLGRDNVCPDGEECGRQAAAEELRAQLRSGGGLKVGGFFEAAPRS